MSSEAQPPSSLETDSFLKDILFTQERMGKGGVPFRMYKIRTMVHGACNDVPEEVRNGGDRSEQDERILPGRKWMRRWGVDELPQIVNVLKGEMAICGPRPIPVDDFECYPEKLRQKYIAVKPGFTSGYPVYGTDKKKRSLRECENLCLRLRRHKEHNGQSLLAFHMWEVLQTVRAVFQGKNR